MAILDTLYTLRYHLDRQTRRRRFPARLPSGQNWPVLLGISFPKSGTNLLRQVLAAFASVGPFADRSFDVFAAFDNRSGAARDVDDALHFLRRLRPADVAAAHLHAWPQVVAEVEAGDYLPYFIYRDPRDVVISHVFYVTEMAPEHVHHRHYAEELRSFDERLRTSILGRPQAGVDFPDIRRRYEPYLGWLDSAAALPLRFEEFILDRRATLERVWEHAAPRLGLETDPKAVVAALERAIVPEKSPTFRSGKVGGWQKHFTTEHKALFKDVAGDLLVRLGYERDDGW